MLETRNEENISYNDIISGIELRSTQMGITNISRKVTEYIEKNFIHLDMDESYENKIALYYSIKTNPAIIEELKNNGFKDKDCEQLYYILFGEKLSDLKKHMENVKQGVLGFIDLTVISQQNHDIRNNVHYLNPDISNRLGTLNLEKKQQIEKVILMIYDRLVTEEKITIEYLFLNYKQLFENIYYTLNDIPNISNPIKSKTDANTILANFGVDEKSLSILYFTLYGEKLEESKIVNMLNVEKLTKNWAAL
ncbi:MAG: hypothetical protein PHN31_01430 [Candidatus Gracilibacteria bacterium]|nr:hypothetical protein [Candidatus Gracilibacteria bacterium]